MISSNGLHIAQDGIYRRGEYQWTDDKDESEADTIYYPLRETNVNAWAKAAMQFLCS